MFKDKTVGFIGGGAIAKALINGMLSAGLVSANQIMVSAKSKETLAKLETSFSVKTADNVTIAKCANIIFLAVKPQVIPSVLNEIAQNVTAQQVIVSVAAGVTLEFLQQKLPGIPLIRVMPNTPIAVSAGMTALSAGEFADQTACDTVKTIFSASGRVVEVAENLLDAVTGLSGSGPGYVFVMLDALSDAGVKAGLPRPVAIELAAQTFYGAAKLLLETGEHPAVLRDKVTSPGGTTIAGIHVLEQRGVRAALMDAVIAAANKSQELKKT